MFRSSFASGFVAGSEARATFSLSVGMILAVGMGDSEFESMSLSSGRFSPLRTFAVGIFVSELLSTTGGSGVLDFDGSLCGD